VDKIRLNRQDIVKYREIQVENADIIVCAYGISARIAQMAVKMARDEGIKAGMLQLITVWPFAEERIRELASQVKAFVVPEINYGQIVFEVERCAGGKAKTTLVPNMGGSVHQPQTILEAIKEAAK
jgi:2-oxoglutarate ferredoxin oxidoreductase subunit alpha